MGAREDGKLTAGAHRFPVRVYYEDTDAAGIVYHANYLRFAERARTELLRDLNVNQRELATQEGLQFVVRSCNIQYFMPARLDDQLTVESNIVSVRGASIVANQLIKSARAELVHLALVIACVDQDGSPARLPRSVRLALDPQESNVLKGEGRWQQ